VSANEVTYLQSLHLDLVMAQKSCLCRSSSRAGKIVRMKGVRTVFLNELDRGQCAHR